MTQEEGVAFQKIFVLKDAKAVEQQVPTIGDIQISSVKVIQTGSKSISDSISGVTSDFLIVKLLQK